MKRKSTRSAPVLAVVAILAALIALLVPNAEAAPATKSSVTSGVLGVDLASPGLVKSIGPNLEILITASATAADCPATFADAMAEPNNPGLAPNHDALASQAFATVYYCVNAKNTGDASAYNVQVTGDILPSVDWDFAPYIPLASYGCGFAGCPPYTEWYAGDEFAIALQQDLVTSDEVRSAVITGDIDMNGTVPAQDSTDDAGFEIATCVYEFDFRWVNFSGGAVSMTFADGTVYAFPAGPVNGIDLLYAMNDQSYYTMFDGFINSDVYRVVFVQDIATINYANGTSAALNCTGF